MSSQPGTAALVEQEEAQRAQLFRITLTAGGLGGTIVLVLFGVFGLLTPNFPAQYLVPIVAGFLALVLLSFWFLRRGRLYWAISIFLADTSVVVFAVIFFLNGVTGPVTPAIIALPLLTALLSGRTETLWMTISAGTLYLVMAILEALEVVQPWQVYGVALLVTRHVLLLFVLVVGTLLVVYSTSLTGSALTTAHQRGQELAEASLQAEQAAQAEREARQREEKIAGQLRQAVREYTAFLQRVSAGDYSARLDLDGTIEAEERPVELFTLGQQLEATVETLIQALADLEAIQRRYVREAWEGFGEAGAAHRGFRYRDGEVEPADEAWLSPMTEAMRTMGPSADERELGIPLTLRGEIVGAIGARRETTTGWSDEDMALAQAIADQLAQTIESLRLLDETQRRAAQDRLIGEITARMRATLDVETVLRTTVDQMYQALGLDELVVRLVADKESSSSPL